MFTVGTNLLAFTTPRRFLMGLSAYLLDPIFLPPTVLVETKTRMFERAMDEHTETASYRQGNVSNKQAEQRKELIQKAVDLFVSEDLPDAKGIFVVRDVNAVEASLVRRIIPNRIFTASVAIGDNNDKRISVETIASDVHYMVTSNMGSIHHARFNQWVHYQYGFNEDFIYAPDAFVHHTLGDKLEEAVHQIAINMTLSNRVRSNSEYRTSLDNFIRNLRPTMPLCSSVIELEERHSPSKNLRWRQGREMIQKEPWRTARAVEEKRVARMSSAGDAIR